MRKKSKERSGQGSRSGLQKNSKAELIAARSQSKRSLLAQAFLSDYPNARRFSGQRRTAMGITCNFYGLFHIWFSQSIIFQFTADVSGEPK